MLINGGYNKGRVYRKDWRERETEREKERESGWGG